MVCMKDILKEIYQISIYLKENTEQINEIAIFEPFFRQTKLVLSHNKNDVSKKWHPISHLSFLSQLSHRIQRVIFKKFPAFIPKSRLSIEAKFRTALGTLLSQENLRDFFLLGQGRRNDFFRVLQETAEALGLSNFSIPEEKNPFAISCELTKMPGRKTSLLEDLSELNLQIAAINRNDRNEILFRILNQVQRPPITSLMEILGKGNKVLSIPLTTRYAKYKILRQDLVNGIISYAYVKDQSTSSIRTKNNSLPDAKGTVNQRVVIADHLSKCLGSFCGELSNSNHVLEQILFILGEKNRELQILRFPIQEKYVKERKIIFTSLYCWHEIGKLSDQYAAIREWDHKMIKSGDNCYKLHLLHFNIPLHALNKFPTPSEIGATIQDLNDEALITLCQEAWKMLGLYSQELELACARILFLRENEMPFLERQKLLLSEIDLFRLYKKTLIETLENCPSSYLVESLKGLLTGKRADGVKLKGIDRFMYLNQLVEQLGYHHNTNCHDSIDRAGSASAINKARHVFFELRGQPFLPGIETQEERVLFKVLYSLYLLWEEPEINAVLNTGIKRDRFYTKFIQKNPDTTKYLIHP